MSNTIKVNKILNTDKKGIYVITSNNIHFSIINTIRRVILSKLDSFAFSKENTIIIKNTSLLDNDQLKHQIANLPIEIDLQKYPNLTIECDFKNDTDDFKNVTAHDIILKNNNEIIDLQYENPYIINTLNSEQELIFRSSIKYEKTGVHGTYMKANCFFNELSDNKYKLIIESYCFQTITDIIKETFEVIRKLIKDFINNVSENLKNNESKIVLEIGNEDDTLGNLVSSWLQNNKKISFSSYKKEHPYIDSVKIYISSNDKTTSTNNIINSSMEDLLKFIKELEKKLV